MTDPVPKIRLRGVVKRFGRLDIFVGNAGVTGRIASSFLEKSG